jgi:hypothetical protein
MSGFKMTFAVAASLLAMGCDHRQPSVAECKRLTEPHAVLERCSRQIGNTIESIRTDACFPFSEPRKFGGVWISGFEDSSFWLGAKKYSRDGMRQASWLSLNTGSAKSVGAQDGSGQLFRIEFLGRRSLCDGHYGHMGMWPSEIIVDQVISATPLKSPYDHR